MAKDNISVIAFSELVDKAQEMLPWMTRDDVEIALRSSDLYIDVYETPDGKEWTRPNPYYLNTYAKNLQAERLVTVLNNAKITSEEKGYAELHATEIALLRGYMIANGIDFDAAKEGEEVAA